MLTDSLVCLLNIFVALVDSLYIFGLLAVTIFICLAVFIAAFLIDMIEHTTNLRKCQLVSFCCSIATQFPQINYIFIHPLRQHVIVTQCLCQQCTTHLITIIAFASGATLRTVGILGYCLSFGELVIIILANRYNTATYT